MKHDKASIRKKKKKRSYFSLEFMCLGMVSALQDFIVLQMGRNKQAGPRLFIMTSSLRRL